MTGVDVVVAGIAYRFYQGRLRLLMGRDVDNPDWNFPVEELRHRDTLESAMFRAMKRDTGLFIPEDRMEYLGSQRCPKSAVGELLVVTFAVDYQAMPDDNIHLTHHSDYSELQWRGVDQARSGVNRLRQDQVTSLAIAKGVPNALSPQQSV